MGMSNKIRPPRSPEDPPEEQRRPSFQEIYDQELDYVWKVLRCLGVPEDRIEDAVQELFVEVHRQLDGYEPRGRLRGWLSSIAVHVAARMRRGEAPHLVVKEPPVDDDEKEDAERDDFFAFQDEVASAEDILSERG